MGSKAALLWVGQMVLAIVANIVNAMGEPMDVVVEDACVQEW